MAKKLTFDEKNDRRACVLVGLGILNTVTLGGLSPIVVPIQAIILNKFMGEPYKEKSNKGTLHKE